MGAEGTDPAAGLPDIRTDADVHRLVERFYEKAPADPLIGHFFAGLDLSARTDLTALVLIGKAAGGKKYSLVSP